MSNLSTVPIHRHHRNRSQPRAEAAHLPVLSARHRQTSRLACHRAHRQPQLRPGSQQQLLPAS